MNTNKSVLISFYISTQGRCSRKVYWLFGFLPYSIYVLGVNLIYLGVNSFIVHGTREAVTPLWLQGGIAVTPLWLEGIIVGLTWLFMWPFLAMLAKRSHDINQSGALSLFMLVPFLGFIVAIIVGLIPGTKGDNKYGADPHRKLPETAQ